MKLLDYEEFVRISYRLETYDSLFYALWKLAKIYLIEADDKEHNVIKTAAVRFDTEGKEIQFLFNEEFWNSINETTKHFVVCHECMHIILCHGIRMKKMNAFNQLGNIAADLLVNTLLIKNFGIQRNQIIDHNNYCWFDTVFEPQKAKQMLNMFNTLTFETIYKELLREQKNIDQPSLVDSHDEMTNSGSSGEEELLKEVFDSINKEMSFDEKQEFSSKLPEEELEEANQEFEEIEEKQNAGKEAGNQSGSGTLFVPKKPVIKKRKWETVVKDWTARQLKQFVEQESWIRADRRNYSFVKDKEMFLPCTIESDKHEKNKLDVWFFLDTSGSCAGYAKRFFSAADSIPTDRFNIRLFCFDTSVYETSFKTRKLYGFGGTSFRCIEYEIQTIIAREKIPYPHAVWILTDGYGDSVSPEMPKRWHWFLTGSYKHYIPNQSKTYMLSNFE